MTNINNCENCHHYNSLIHWEEGLFHQCMMGNKLWEKCNDYDAIEEEKMIMKRFIVKNIMFDGDCIVDTINEGYYTADKQDLENLCNILNELYEENDILKQELKIKVVVNRQYEELQTLKKENEQLKIENKKLNERIGILEGSLIDKGFDIND